MKKIFLSFITSLLILSGCAAGVKNISPPEAPPILQKLPDMVAGDYNNFQTEKNIYKPEVQDTLTLSKALALTLILNTELSVYSMEIRSREAILLQTDLFPNPELGIEIENFLGNGYMNGFKQTETTISIGQLIPLAGKLGKAKAAAEHDLKLAGHEYQATRLKLYSSVIQAYHKLLLAQEKLLLNKSLVKISGQLLGKVKKRVEAGAMSPAEISRAEVELINAKVALKNSLYVFDNAKITLSSHWNSSTPDFQYAKGKQPLLERIPRLEKLQNKLTNNPDLNILTVKILKSKAELEMEKSLAVPDLSIALGIRHFNETSDNALVAGLSVPIPVFNRNQGNIQSAKILVRQSEMQKIQMQIFLKNRLRAAYARLKALQATILYIEQSGIPQAKRAWKIFLDGYRKGKFQMLDIIDAQRSLYKMKTRYAEAKTEYQITINEIETIIGVSLNQL